MGVTKMGARLVVGNETITSSGITKVDIKGEDGLNGVAKIDDNEITLNIVHTDRYLIKLTSDGSVIVKVYKPLKILPFMKLSDQHTDAQGFAVIKERLRSGHTYVHDVFSDIILGMTATLSDGQLECLRSNDHVRAATLALQTTNLINLKSALLRSKESWQTRKSKSTKEELADLDRMVATAFNMDPK
jgi:hypothetical protein